MSSRPLFNPAAQVVPVRLDNGQHCYVVDDALSEPERLLDWATEQREAFRPVDFSAYPGRYVLLTAAMNIALEAFFQRHMRPLFDARRLVHYHARLAMVTVPPHALRPAQWLCHSDHFRLERTQSIQASVLYLFKDAALGGTGFYEPARPAQEMSVLFDDAVKLSPGAFSDRYGLVPAYLQASNRYFHRIGGVPARWNRLVFYDGTLLHSGDILAPDRLSEDPALARLSMNGFFTCRRHAAR